eukprot:198750-Amphidinium_carterae.2
MFEYALRLSFLSCQPSRSANRGRMQVQLLGLLFVCAVRKCGHTCISISRRLWLLARIAILASTAHERALLQALPPLLAAAMIEQQHQNYPTGGVPTLSHMLERKPPALLLGVVQCSVLHVQSRPLPRVQHVLVATVVSSRC